MVAYGEGEEYAQNLSAEDGRENTASCMSDRVTKAEVRQRTITKDIVAVAHSSSGVEGAMCQESAIAFGQKLHHCGT
jgi:hypothetical protein